MRSETGTSINNLVGNRISNKMPAPNGVPSAESELGVLQRIRNLINQFFSRENMIIA